MIRARYVNIVEEILAREPVAGVTQAILDDFKAKQCSGAFFCRHRTCPRAAQGYNTPELRHMHEESHVPKFQCTEVACGFFGWPFNTQAAFKKHIIQYHDEEKIASIPDSLANVQCRSHKDRSLFALTKSKEKMSVEEFISPGAPSGATSVDNDDDEFLRTNANGVRYQKPAEHVMTWTPEPASPGGFDAYSPESDVLLYNGPPLLHDEPILGLEKRVRNSPLQNDAVYKLFQDPAKTAGKRPRDFYVDYDAIPDKDGTDSLFTERVLPPPPIPQQWPVRYDMPSLKANYMDPSTDATSSRHRT